MQKITLVSHNDSLTGAPRLLINLADLLVEQGYTVTFVIKHATGSGLLSLRKQAFKILVLKNYRHTISGRVANVFQQKYTLQQFIQVLKQSDIVINNTIDNADLLPLYNQYAAGKVISYLHELEGVIDTHLPTLEEKRALVQATAHFFVPSTYVKYRVARKLNISAEKISVLNYTLPKSTIDNNLLKIVKPANEFWVGMCGTADMRKGVDVFVKIAATLKQNYPPLSIKLVWLGFEGDSAKLMEEDIRKLNLQDIIQLLPRTLYPEAFFKKIDVFALTSREDPYPLVVLSAANAAKPIICFEQSGGIIDFITNKCGLSVPFLDIDAFCEKIVYLYNHPEFGQQLGVNAQKKVKEWHQTDEVIVAQLTTVFAKIPHFMPKIARKPQNTEGVYFF
jgi:glycosyltransferase involved in cell wall biosynthesis